MIPIARVDQIAGEVAVANLSPSNVDDVSSKPASDSEGRDALRITIVIRPDAASELAGDKLLDTLVQIQARLHEEGEERLAIVEYTTRQELEDSGDTQS